MFCKNCGANIPDGSVFCSVCGKNTAGLPSDPQMGYGNAMPTPKKGIAPWIIVLICILAVAIAGGLVFLGIKLFETKPSNASNLDSMYDNIFLKDDIPINTPAKSITPLSSETPAPTEGIATPLTDAVIDLPYDFVTINYPEMLQVGANFSSSTDFTNALMMGTTWVYQASYKNPSAVMFNSGYIDSGDRDSEALHAYIFKNDDLVTYTELDPQSMSVVYEESETYYTQNINGVWYVCVDTGQKAVYNGIGFDVLITLFINTNGELVGRIAMYDAHTDTLFFISCDNVYSLQTIPSSTVLADTHPPMDWNSQEEFEEMLQSYIWSYAATVDSAIDFVLPSYQDITPDSKQILLFNTDGIIDATEIDSTSGEVIGENSISYDLGDYHAYVYLGEHEEGGVVYEVDAYYYIDENEYLIETVRLYNFDNDTYYIVSNANTFEPLSP